MKVVVDFDRCEANALCTEEAPEVFKLDENDFLQVLIEEPDESLRAKIDKAVVVCPRNAISIEES